MGRSPRGPLAIAAALALAPVSLSGQAEHVLVGAVYDVDVSGDTATVTARFEWGPEAREDRLTLKMIRFPGVGLDIIGPASTGRVEGSDALFRVSVPHGGSLAYRATGLGHRIPLFVPDVPLGRGGRGVRIRVTGVEGARGSFPRLVERGDTYVASLANVPGFIMVPPLYLGFSYKDIFDGLVVLLLAGALGVWVRGRVRALRLSGGEG